MELILDLYEKPLDPRFPVVCLDECARQLTGDLQEALPLRPGDARREDYEYERRGTCNLFVTVEPLAGRRQVVVTDQRTSKDFAERLRQLVDVDYPEAEKIILVQDNLNTHRVTTLWQVFEPAEALRIAKRLDFHYTPKHASWLNMAEIEIAALQKQCLARRLPDINLLRQEVAAWTQQRNNDQVRISWTFTVEKARAKMTRLYAKKLS
jgi:transposase